MDANVERLERADDFTFTAWRGIVLLVWRSHTTAQGIDRSQIYVQARASSRGGPVVLLNVVPPQPAKPPDIETRKAMGRVLQNPPPALVGVGTVYEGGGFVAAFVRSLITALQRTPSDHAPMKMFRSVAECAPWVAAVLGDTEITAEGLAGAIAIARQG